MVSMLQPMPVYVHSAVCPPCCVPTVLHAHHAACPPCCMLTVLHAHCAVCPSCCVSTVLRAHRAVCPLRCVPIVLHAHHAACLWPTLLRACSPCPHSRELPVPCPASPNQLQPAAAIQLLCYLVAEPQLFQQALPFPKPCFPWASIKNLQLMSYLVTADGTLSPLSKTKIGCPL